MLLYFCALGCIYTFLYSPFLRTFLSMAIMNLWFVLLGDNRRSSWITTAALVSSSMWEKVIVLMLIQKAFLFHFTMFVFCLYWFVFHSGGCEEDEQVQPYYYPSPIWVLRLAGWPDSMLQIRHWAHACSISHFHFGIFVTNLVIFHVNIKLGLFLYSSLISFPCLKLYYIVPDAIECLGVV